MKNIKIFVDKLEKYDLGGYTTDPKKAEYILATQRLTFNKILSGMPSRVKIPSGGFTLGKYVVMFNISWDLENINVGLLHYEIDLDKHFDVFADCMSPKSVAGFHQLREKIKGMSELDPIELSDNDSEFMVAYENYIEYIKSH